MGFVRWWRERRQGQREALMFEARWVVAVEDECVAVFDSEGIRRHIALTELGGVAIETNDSGPWSADVWWLLFDSDDSLAVTWPQGATGEQASIDRLMALPGFAMEEMIRAVTSTDNAVFPLWRRAGD
jgi:hypothetical protein